MGDSEHEFVSEFDNITTTDRIRMLKSALPYVEIGMQKYMAIYIKFLELMYTIQYFRNEPQNFSAHFSKGNNNDPREIMNGIKKYCSKSEQASMEQILQMMQAFEMYKKYQSVMQPLASMNSEDPLSSLMGMLTPEQQKMFEMFKEM